MGEVTRPSGRGRLVTIQKTLKKTARPTTQRQSTVTKQILTTTQTRKSIILIGSLQESELSKALGIKKESVTELRRKQKTKTELVSKSITIQDLTKVQTPKQERSSILLSGVVSISQLGRVPKIDTITRLTSPPKRPPPVIATPIKPFRGIITSRKSKPRPLKRRTKYRPSVVGVVLGVRGRKPSRLTGLEVRPL